ncbi:hypothetical protein N9O24_00500 [bacterium]|nr:hypothetical protein [bacterium]
MMALGDWVPWKCCLNATRAPYYQWFQAGAVSAAFNEIDRHVLDGFETMPAFAFDSGDGSTCYTYG